jgi:hypothetical protein
MKYALPVQRYFIHAIDGTRRATLFLRFRTQVKNVERQKVEFRIVDMAM